MEQWRAKLLEAENMLQQLEERLEQLEQENKQLQEIIEPFRDQLESFEIEKNALLSQVLELNNWIEGGGYMVELTKFRVSSVLIKERSKR